MLGTLGHPPTMRRLCGGVKDAADTIRIPATRLDQDVESGHATGICDQDMRRSVWSGYGGLVSSECDYRGWRCLEPRCRVRARLPLVTPSSNLVTARGRRTGLILLTGRRIALVHVHPRPDIHLRCRPVMPAAGITRGGQVCWPRCTVCSSGLCRASGLWVRTLARARCDPALGDTTRGRSGFAQRDRCAGGGWDGRWQAEDV